MVDMRSVSPQESALLDVTQRLARQLEQQIQQLRRMREGEWRSDVVAGLGELERSAHRMLRDGERLRMLCGSAPVVPGPVRTVAELVDGAVAATADPTRVIVRSAPAAGVGPRPAAELGHVLSVILDDALGASRSAVTITCRLGSAGLAVDVTTDASGNGQGRGAPGLAVALARSGGAGIRVESPAASGAFATVLCPAAALVGTTRSGAEPSRAPAMQEIGWSSPPPPAAPAEPYRARGSEAYQPFGTAAVSSSAGLFAPSGVSAPPSSAREPARPPRSFSSADPLFGPLPSRGHTPDVVATPIYEAVASAWFREDRVDLDSPSNGHSMDWDSPGDDEWRAAAARAARADSDPATITAAGLPRRRPGGQMVTPPLQRGSNSHADRNGTARPEERVPDRVRDRLDNYQRGMREGRHRLAEPAPAAEREMWWAEPGA